jgi:hypothetical protein
MSSQRMIHYISLASPILVMLITSAILAQIQQQDMIQNGKNLSYPSMCMSVHHIQIWRSYHEIVKVQVITSVPGT